MARGKFIVFGKPAIAETEIREVVRCLRSGWIGTGSLVRRFEEDFADYKGVPYAVALHSCTAALHLSMLAAGIRPGDEVIVPSMTFAATANAVVHAGGVPVFADCRPDTMNLDPEDVRRRLTRRTRAVIPVHFAGRPCEMDAILALARRRRLKVIEDCAHAIEALYHGRPAGTMGDLGCFSFYVTKNLVTAEGGMVTTRNGRYADFIKVAGLHGMSRDAWRRFSDKGYRHYQVVTAGFKYNMTNIQAAMGVHQLKRLEASLKKRERLWRMYDRAFADLPLAVPAPAEKGTRHARHLYTVLLDLKRVRLSRDAFLEALRREGIGTGVHYTALHRQPFYRGSSGVRGPLPNTERIAERTVSLPLGPGLSDAEAGRVIGAVRRVLKGRRA